MTETKEIAKTKQEIARWNASNERNPIRLGDLDQMARKELMARFGLPEKVNPAHVVALGGKPYIDHTGLWDLTHQDYVVVKAFHVEPPIFKPCSEMGCVARIQKGWKTNDGTIYDEYPQGQKAYKHYVEAQPKEHERMAIVHYRVEIKDRKTGEISIYEAFGDACPHNCTSVTRDSLMRMAETRAINRCLRPAVGYAGTSYEERIVELGENGTESKVEPPAAEPPTPKGKTGQPQTQANGKRLRDFPGAMEQIKNKLAEEKVIDQGSDGEQRERTIQLPLFLEWLQSEGMLDPDEKGALHLENMLFVYASALQKKWDEQIAAFWKWVDATYPEQGEAHG